MTKTIPEKKRILLVVAYDGTEYSGFQAQKSGARTIEGELNRCLSELTGESIEVIGASRTDAGVHALCNAAVFDTCSRIPAEKFSYALNVRLPEDIRIQGSVKVPPDFHPRHQNTVKTYEYHIYNARQPLPTKNRFAHFSYVPYDIDKMRKAADRLIGEHDFKSFCSVYTQALTTVRTITDLKIEEIPVSADGVLAMVQETSSASSSNSENSDMTGPSGESACEQTDNARRHFPREIVIRVSGTGFLYNMVRIIAGTLMDVGRGRLTPEEIPDILNARDRTKAGPTAPAKGLILTDYTFQTKML